MLHEPVLNYDFSLQDAAAKGGWQSANNYCMWVGLQAPDEPAYQLLVRRADKILSVPLKPRVMHLIDAGAPYRMAHLFAPWRQSDADTIYLRVVEPEGIYSALLTAMSQPVRNDHVVWICPSCGREAAREPYDARANGLIEFWAFQLERVRAVNAAAKPCPSCGKALPFGYGFDKEHDTPQEAAARRAG